MIGVSGEVRLKLTALVAAAAVLCGCASAPATLSTSAPGIGARAASVALEQVGQPYRYGGAHPGGFDCSGLVYYAYGRAGKALPRTTGELWDFSATVTRDDLEPGDLLFFSIAGKMQHVGLYVGDGRFVHAPSSGRVVAVASLRSDYYRTALLRAGRPL